MINLTPKPALATIIYFNNLEIRIYCYKKGYYCIRQENYQINEYGEEKCIYTNIRYLQNSSDGERFYSLPISDKYCIRLQLDYIMHCLSQKYINTKR